MGSERFLLRGSYVCSPQKEAAVVPTGSTTIILADIANGGIETPVPG